MHQIAINAPVSVPDDGLVLGNGDLSVSVFQRDGEVVFKLGKSDVWDTRIELEKNPVPAHIDELRELLDEKEFSREALGNGHRSKGELSDRQQEICSSTPAMRYPYPCPKPTGEVVMFYPPDFQGLKISQILFIEEGRIELHLSWDNGVELRAGLVVHPVENRISLRYEMTPLAPELRYGGDFYGLPRPYPVCFAFFREDDPDYNKEKFRIFRHSRYPSILQKSLLEITPLPPAEYFMSGGYAVCRQRFPEEKRGTGKFEYSITAAGKGLIPRIQAECAFLEAETLEHYAGELVITVNSGVENSHAGAIAGAEKFTSFADDAAAARSAAQEFFRKSSFSGKDKFMEDLWYSTLHIKRATLKAGKVQPGLFLPSTVIHFPAWHGDYHTNYNIQSNYLGDYSANHFDTGDGIFDALAGQIEAGRKIAAEYYNCRGSFIQLSAFPFAPADDHQGGLPFGRLAYMTGWTASLFYQRWRYSMDREFLAAKGYPAIRDFALFYTDFLRRDEHGQYHAYPSQQGEADFTKAGCTDQPQVVRHIRCTLRYAVECAQELDTDRELVELWQQISAHLPFAGGADSETVSPRCPAEFSGFDGGAPKSTSEMILPGQQWYDWYCGHQHFLFITAMRCGLWENCRDWERMQKVFKRFIRPNGILNAMALANYGRNGAWMESLGVLGVINEMLLASWDGKIELFPFWPDAQDAEFTTLRAEGALLVSAGMKQGKLTALEVYAEKSGSFEIIFRDERFTVDCRAGECCRLR
ncbi:MAG: hypothetical protein E7058_07765 [Lentisphaerae bacterium]|nr:hypothetical protein [Lentisphaerota bacterium]